MTQNKNRQTGVVVWAMGILIWINFLSALISTYHFGYIDWATVAQMSAIAFPPLAVGAVAIYRIRAARAERQTAGFRGLAEAGR